MQSKCNFNLSLFKHIMRCGVLSEYRPGLEMDATCIGGGSSLLMNKKNLIFDNLKLILIKLILS